MYEYIYVCIDASMYLWTLIKLMIEIIEKNLFVVNLGLLGVDGAVTLAIRGELERAVVDIEENSHDFSCDKTLD